MYIDFLCKELEEYGNTYRICFDPEEKGGGKPQATKLHFPPRPLP